jgi:hypothetical protein
MKIERRHLVRLGTIGRSMRIELLLPLLLTGALLVSGCTIKHEYTWTKYELSQERIAAANVLGQGTTVSITNEQPDTESRVLGYLGAHQYLGSLHQLTEATVTQLSQELEARKVAVTNNATKTLKIKVENTKFTLGSWMMRLEMSVHVEAGNGYVRQIEISNRTPSTVPRAVDGAVALAVTEILKDPDIIAYLQG